MNEVETIRRELEIELSVLLSHELAERNSSQLYILLASETGIDWGQQIAGATSPRMASMFQSRLGSRWRGNGPAIMLNDDCQEMLKSPYGRMSAVCCHELAHIVLRKEFFAPSHWSIFDQYALKNAVEVPECETVPKCKLKFGWEDHDARFLRLSLHIADRLKRALFPIAQHFILDWDYFAPSGPWAYMQALAGEFEQFKSLTLSQLAKTLPASRFLDVWNCDRAVVTRFEAITL